MTPDRIQEIRQRLEWGQHSTEWTEIQQFSDHLFEDITDLLAALATAEAKTIDAMAEAHGVGQESTIHDVNAGLLDDLIAQRLATAEAEGRRQGIEEIRDKWRNTADNDTDLFSAWLGQLLPEAPR